MYKNIHVNSFYNSRVLFYLKNNSVHPQENGKINGDVSQFISKQQLENCDLLVHASRIMNFSNIVLSIKTNPKNAHFFPV